MNITLLFKGLGLKFIPLKMTKVKIESEELIPKILIAVAIAVWSLQLEATTVDSCTETNSIVPNPTIATLFHNSSGVLLTT